MNNLPDYQSLPSDPSESIMVFLTGPWDQMDAADRWVAEVRMSPVDHEALCTGPDPNYSLDRDCDPRRQPWGRILWRARLTPDPGIPEGTFVFVGEDPDTGAQDTTFRAFRTVRDQ